MMDNVQICGIPSDLPVDKAAIFRSRLLLAYSDIRPLLSDPLPIISIGDILESAGYSQTLMIGSDAEFGGRKLFYESHGDYDIVDYNYALENNKKWL